jgi:hypothetical protein
MSDLVSSAGFLVGIGLGCCLVLVPLVAVYRYWRLPVDVRRMADALEFLARNYRPGASATEPEDAVQKSLREMASRTEEARR